MMKKPKANKKKVDHKKISSKISSKKSEKTYLQQVDWRIWAILGVVVLLIFAILLNVLINVNGRVITGMTDAPIKGNTNGSSDGRVQEGTWEETLNSMTWTNSKKDVNPVFPTILRAIFGPPVKIRTGESETNSAISAIILTVCAWLLIFLTFSDIISSFSSFSKGVSWGIGAIFATIMAQFNWQVAAMIWISSITGIAGGLLVGTGIIGAFAAFFVSNWGITKFKKWAVQRKALITASNIRAQGAKYKSALGILGMLGNQAAKDSKKD
jgi:drug/metabolite transporter superfamily protein YnfA